MHTPTSLVTGGSGAIGSALIQLLATQGHKVINLSLDEPSEPLPAVTYCVDLMDREATARTLEQIANEHKVDHLVNNAGISYQTTIETLSLDRMQQMVEIHNRAALQCLQALIPGMKARGYGRIVQIGSRMMLGRQGRLIYSMVKAGLLGMSRSLALEVAPHGITVNMVSPGPIETPFFRQVHPPGAEQTMKLLSGIPVGRIGTAEDVANAVAFFLQPSSGFITGQNLFVCGGGSIGTSNV
ncbi:SDR family oxidoreductase [Comamonas testosteroni]|uniref:SDR family oxidoreductase n=1 Tax=Comamonas testosteroni TaxID=285 RepID=UPI0038999560